MNDHDSSTSKFLVDDYEGISSDFIEMEPLPSREGYCAKGERGHLSRLSADVP